MISRVIPVYVIALCASFAWAEVVRVEVSERQAVLDGKIFGQAGAYEKLSGTVHFAFDATSRFNARITDLALAPKDSEARVLASADFMVLRPIDADKSAGIGLVEVSNRGGKALLPLFNAGSFSHDPVSAQDYGDALLLRLGYTLIWVGWQFDVPDEPGLLRLNAPVASDNGASITGPVRADWTVDAPSAILPLAHRNHLPYAPAAADSVPAAADSAPAADSVDDVLTVREAREAKRTRLPRQRWRFVDASGAATEAPTHIALEGGFAPGKLYELVYRARDPAVVGLGLAALRDIAAYAKYNRASAFPVRHALAFGVSQSGRLLRHFVYQGFNTDERGRKVYDGLFIHAAGAGRGSFNHRFAQPSRDAHRYATFFYPTDLFPFSGRTQRDATADVNDGLLAHAFDAAHLPKLIYTNTGYEYWGRAASLIHTTPDGRADADPLPNERIYHLASGQHFVINFPLQPHNAHGVFRGNSVDFLVNLRALLPRLALWVTHDRAPPASRFPRINDDTLVAPSELAFPVVTGFSAAKSAHQAYRVDYGPRWQQGVIDIEPPKLLSSFPSLVPQVDRFGNELGGVRNVELRVPLATQTPWNLREGLANPHELVDFYGSFAPLPRDAAEKSARQDPRAALSELYRDRDEFLQRVGDAARELASEGFLLEEDIPRVQRRNARLWDWVVNRSQ